MTAPSRCRKCGKEAVLVFSITEKPEYIYHCSDEECDAWMINGRLKSQEISEAIENWNSLQE